MRVSREKFAESRKRILEAAATLFREKGFDGVGLGDIMKAAGLTHGGFYGHFGSKEDLEAQALSLAMARSLTIWSQTVVPGIPGSRHAARSRDLEKSHALPATSRGLCNSLRAAAPPTRKLRRNYCTGCLPQCTTAILVLHSCTTTSRSCTATPGRCPNDR